MADTSLEKKPYRIPLPDGFREPMRVNVFEYVRTANTQLAPFFAYFGEGAMVPAVAVMRGGENVDYGQFFHWNTVDEVIMAFGSAGSLTDSGFAFVGANMHGVNSFLKNQEDPNSFLVVTITQRQRIGEEQREAVVIRCAKCKEVITRVDFDATPPKPGTPEEIGPFPTIIYSGETALRFNASEATRTCPKCGTVNPPFPLQRWGWADYTEKSRTGDDARRAFADAAAALAGAAK